MPGRCSGRTSPRSACCRARRARTSFAARSDPATASTVMQPAGPTLDDPVDPRGRRAPGAPRRSAAGEATDDGGRTRPQGDRRAAAGESTLDRDAACVRPAERHQHLRGGGPQALRDARQSHGDRPRERPVGAIAGAARPAQGGAPPPGVPRPAHRTGQPLAVHPGRRLASRIPRPGRIGAGRPVRRPGRLQAGQRQPRPRGGRCAPGRRRRSPPFGAARDATWRPDSAATSSRCFCATRPT